MTEYGRLWRALLAVLLAIFAAPAALGDAPSKSPSLKGDPQVRPAADGSLFNGKDLTGWHAPQTQDFQHQKAVTVEDGALVLAMGQPASGVVWKGQPPRENYEISLEARRLEGNDFFCGLTFPVGDSYCTFIVGGWGGGTTGLSNLDGYSAVENETTGYSEFQQGRWYRIRVRVTKETVSAAIDDEELFNVTRKDRKFSVWWEQEPMRPLGIAAWRTKAAVRNIRLTSLNHEAKDRSSAQE